MSQITFYFISALLVSGNVRDSNSQDENTFVPPAILVKVLEKCAKNNVPLNPMILGTVKECLEPTVELAHERDPEGARPIETFCEFLPEVAKCYEPLFQLAESCAPEWVDNAHVFRPQEVATNLQRALCAEEKPKRVQDVLLLGDEGLSAALCLAIHRDAILSDVLETKVLRGLAKDPFGILSDKACEIIDKIEDGLLTALDLCDKPQDAVRFAKKFFDVVAGIVFKCEAHENF